MTTLDPYTTLGIPPGASRAEAARAHRRLAKQFHPDVHPGAEAAERMRRLNEAWRILSSPERRARYDAERATPHWPGPGHGAGSRAGPWAAYGPPTSTATWTTWPESRVAAAPRARRPARADEPEPGFGDRPLVLVILSVGLGLLYFIGTWLGSIAP